MATIEEEMKAQIANEQLAKLQAQELEERMKAYKYIESINSWVKFFGILAIITLALIFLGFV